MSSTRLEDEQSCGEAVEPATENAAVHLIKHFDFAAMHSNAHP
jgi:hypothetical protein